MQRRSKIMVIALVICLACGAAYFFRKRGPSSADVLSPTSHAAGESEFDRRGSDKPAPQSHLLGEIQTMDQPAGGRDLAPVAPAPPMDPFTERRLSAGHAPLRTSGEPSTIVGRAENQSFAPPAGAPQGFGASPFSGSGAGGAPSEVIRHKVVDGDTLTGLSERFLGNGNRFIEIYELNRDTVASPDLLPIGVELKIPARGLVAPPSTPEDPQPMVPLAPAGQPSASADARGAGAYLVRRNDTLTGIAKQVYGDARRYPELLEANRQQLSRPEDLRAGVLLIVP